LEKVLATNIQIIEPEGIKVDHGLEYDLEIKPTNIHLTKLINQTLRNLQAPPGLSKTKARFLKLKATKFCILDNSLYWKDPGGIFLSCILEFDME
jgi:hypothetical protein